MENALVNKVQLPPIMQLLKIIIMLKKKNKLVNWSTEKSLEDNFLNVSPGQVAQLIRVWSLYTKVVGSIPSGHIQESTSECINKWNNKSMFLSLSLSLGLTLGTLSLSFSPSLPFFCLKKLNKNIKNSLNVNSNCLQIT